APPTTALSTPSLHDALPIYRDVTLLERSAICVEHHRPTDEDDREQDGEQARCAHSLQGCGTGDVLRLHAPPVHGAERAQSDHRQIGRATSELQSRRDLVCRL